MAKLTRSTKIVPDKLSELLALQKEAVEADAKAKEALAAYKKKTKELLGYEDGQPLNLLQLADFVLRLVG